MATFSNIDGEESATVTFRVATVQITRGSTDEQQEILVLGDPESSVAIARVSSIAPASSDAGLVVRQVGHSTTVNVSSLAGAVIVRSSAADFAATVSGNVGQASTVWAVQVDGIVRAQNSTIGDLLASVQQNSTVWQTQAALRTSSGGGLEGSTNGVPQGALGLHVRIAPSSVQTFAASTVGATSTNTVLVSSQANPIKVWSYCITSTVVTPSTVSFRSSLAGLKWPLVLGSGSSGITGANLASQPPHFLFQTDANTALTFHTPSSGPEYSIAISYST